MTIYKYTPWKNCQFLKFGKIVSFMNFLAFSSNTETRSGLCSSRCFFNLRLWHKRFPSGSSNIVLVYNQINLNSGKKYSQNLKNSFNQKMNFISPSYQPSDETDQWYLFMVKRKRNQSEFVRKKKKTHPGKDDRVVSFFQANSFWFLILFTVNKYNHHVFFIWTQKLQNANVTTWWHLDS